MHLFFTVCERERNLCALHRLVLLLFVSVSFDYHLQFYYFPRIQIQWHSLRTGFRLPIESLSHSLSPHLSLVCQSVFDVCYGSSTIRCLVIISVCVCFFCRFFIYKFTRYAHTLYTLNELWVVSGARAIRCSTTNTQRNQKQQQKQIEIGEFIGRYNKLLQ